MILIGNRLTVGIVHDKNLIGMSIIYYSGEMDVIKMSRVLIAEHQTHVAMRTFFGGLAHLNIEHKIAHYDVFEQRDIPGTAVWQFFRNVDVLELAECLAAIDIDQLPSLRTCRLPVLGARGKFFVEQFR